MSNGARVSWTYSGAKNRAFSNCTKGSVSTSEHSYIRSTTLVVLPSRSELRTFIRAVDKPPPESRTEGMNRKAHSAKWDGPSQGGTAFQIASCEALRAQKKDHHALPRGVNSKQACEKLRKSGDHLLTMV